MIKKSIAGLVCLWMMAAVLCAGAAKAGDNFSVPATPEQIASLNAIQEQVFRDIPEPDQKVANALIDKVHERGVVPVIVRLCDQDLPYGFFSDKKSLRAEIIGSLQSKVVGNLIAQTAVDEASLHVKRFSLIPAMALLVDAQALEALRIDPNVIDIVEDIPSKPFLYESVPLIGAGPDGSFSGYTGQGQTVAILDTGVDKNHLFLSGKVVSEACYSNYYGEDTSLCPGGVTQSTAVNSALPCVSLCYHGTHVAGIAAGKRLQLTDGTPISGVAKDANIIAIQVFTQFNNDSDCDGDAPCVLSYDSDQLLGLERVYALRNTYSIASVNMSLGGGEYSAPCDTNPLKPVIDMLRAEDIATVIASGNDSYPAALGAPACISSAVSVGSTTKTDVVSSFSNSAYFLSLLAPGGFGDGTNNDILSSIPGGAGNLLEFLPGTSMAAPHVAGAWAVIKQAKPDAGVTEVLSALQNTGVPVTDTRVGAGYKVTPRIDVQAALELPKCELTIKYKPPLAVKLTKSKKLKLTITGGEGFDPYGKIDLGPFMASAPKVNIKKRSLSVTALVPAGFPRGTYPVLIGGCSGKIEIL